MALNIYPITMLLSLSTAAVFFAQGNRYDFTSFFLIVPLAISVPRMLGNATQNSMHVRHVLDWLAFGLVILNIPGVLYFHEHASHLQYDRFGHFSVGFLLVPTAIYTLALFRPGLRFSRRAFLGLLFVLFLGLFAWEGMQYLRDRVFGTKTFYDYSQSIERDFVEDILLGSAGLSLWFLLRKRIRFLDPS